MSELGHNNPPELISRQSEYKGYTITITDYFNFQVSGADWPEREARTAYSTYVEAKNEIDAHIKRMNKTETVRKTLKVAVRDEKGALLTFRGFNGNTSEAMTTPDRKDGYYLYPDVPWLTKLLIERGRLNERIKEIGALTQNYRLNSKAKSFGGRIDADRYQPILDQWLQELSYKRETAEKNAPAETAV